MSIGLLILFLDTLARSIVSETVIERVGEELDELLDAFAPLRPMQPGEVHALEAAPADFQQGSAYFGCSEGGYVQAIQFDELIAIAEKADVLIGLYFRPGHYVVAGARDIGLYPKDRFNEKLAAEINKAIIVGVHRTPVQDPDFSIRNLDEIAVRALSAGVNDPYTAVAVIDRLSLSLCKLMGRALPRAIFRDDEGVVRVLSTEANYAGLIGAAFNQIRQNGAGTPIIVLHLLEAITRIAQRVRIPEQHEALSAHANAIVEAARRRIDDPFDLKSIDERYASTQHSLDLAAWALQNRAEIQDQSP